MYLISWGYWSQGISELANLASIGFMPAKMYFDPAHSTCKNPTGFKHIGQYLNSCGEYMNAAKWFRKGAVGGEPHSMVELAKYLIVGRGGEKRDYG